MRSKHTAGPLAWASLFRPFGALILTATPRVQHKMWDTLSSDDEGWRPERRGGAEHGL